MIIDLKEKSGLGLKFDIDKTEMVFDKDLKSSSPAIRSIDQMKEVLLDSDIREPEELYYMYRDIHRLGDRSILEKHKLRYDVTVIKPSRLGREFMKTAGHYHPENFGELYEVAYGRCFCLLQQYDPADYRIIRKVILVEATAGQKIVIPPRFGHILINPGPDYLITSNWVSSCFKSRYELYRQAEGAAYFITASEGSQMTTPCLGINVGIMKNAHFKEAAGIAFAQPAREVKRFGLTQHLPMYNLIGSNPRFLDFLNHPLDYEYNDVFKFADANDKTEAQAESSN